MNEPRVAALLAATFVVISAGCRARAPVPDYEPLDRAPKARAESDRLPPLRDHPQKLVLGILPIFAPAEMAIAYAPLASYLGEKLGSHVETVLSPDYPSMVDRVVKGEIDLVQLAPLAYVVAKKRAPSLEMLVTNISEGSSTYSGYILARAGGVTTLEGLRGKRFGFVDRDSASGYLYPYAFLLDHGVDPQKYFREIVWTQRHDLALANLAEGKIDATATFSGALDNAEAHGIDVEKLMIIAKTGRIPYDAWCVRADLAGPIKDHIKVALLSLSMRTVEGRRILGPLRSINGFAPGDDTIYDPLRRVKVLVDSAAAE
jgi:phosphate/phosphite/phosphonate ABC transporter binding protein